MKTNTCGCLSALLTGFLFLPLTVSGQTTAQTAPTNNSSYIDAQGTAHVTRVVPVPDTISPEAQKFLARPATDEAKPQTVAERRSGIDKWQAAAGVVSQSLYPTDIGSDTMAGVPVRVVTPKGGAARKDCVLMNLHGGGFVVDSGSLSETVPIASLTRTKVIAVLYRMAPEHPFPAAVDDAIAVYKELLKNYKPDHIAVYGTSAGAILTAEFAVKAKQLGLPEPAALGIFSGLGDYARLGDSENIFALGGFSGHMDASTGKRQHDDYVGTTDPKNPVLSPVYADLHGLPPTLFLTSTRDALLSGTANLDRAFLHAGVDEKLVVFDALTHAFWNDPRLPESKEADQMMADFFLKHLGR